MHVLHACVPASSVPQLSSGSASCDAGLSGCRALPVGSAHCALAACMRSQLQFRSRACFLHGPLVRALLRGIFDLTSCDMSGVRADYEVDFITFFTRLTGTKMGAKFDDEAYLVPIKIDVPKL